MIWSTILFELKIVGGEGTADGKLSFRKINKFLLLHEIEAFMSMVSALFENWLALCGLHHMWRKVKKYMVVLSWKFFHIWKTSCLAC